MIVAMKNTMKLILKDCSLNDYKDIVEKVKSWTTWVHIDGGNCVRREEIIGICYEGEQNGLSEAREGISSGNIDQK